ncbi:MAG TPA: hypothetical protein PKD12_06740 [Nitrospira sp.]|nr:hypothetical protein [Nitrospira sp.]
MERVRDEARDMAGIATSVGNCVGCDGIATDVAALAEHPMKRKEIVGCLAL